MVMLVLEHTRGRPTLSLRTTWCPRASRWWPLPWSFLSGRTQHARNFNSLS